jgi:cytochrome b561
MAKIIDYLFLQIFHNIIHLKKDKDGAKWSTMLFTGLYITATVIAFLCLLGLLQHDNYASTLLKMNSTAFVMITGVIIALLFYLRYYRYTSVAIIETSYNAMNNYKRMLVDMLVYAAMIAVPVLAFILYRLYVIGHL